MVLHLQSLHRSHDQCTIRHTFLCVLAWPLAIVVEPPMVYRAPFSICRGEQNRNNKNIKEKKIDRKMFVHLYSN